MKHLLIIIIFLTSFAILSSEVKPYQVYLKPGSELIDTKSKSRLILQKGIYANVLATDPMLKKWFSVYGKDGKVKYVTLSNSVVEFAEDIKILPNVVAETSYPEPIILNGYNKNIFFDTQFNIHSDSIDISPLNALYPQGKTSLISNRFELRTLYTSELPVNFGLGINYQNAEWSNEFDSIQLKILSMGPQFQRYIYEEEQFAVSLLLGAEFAPIYATKSGNSLEKYKAVMLDLGVEALWGTRFGKWTIGAHYRRHDLTLTSTTRPGVMPIPEGYIITSIGALVGYKYEWEL